MIVAALVVIGIVGFINVSHDIHPTGQAGHVVSVSIPNGASTSKVGDLLAKDGVIHGPLVFELYVKLEGAGPLMPGTYHLATNQPYASVRVHVGKRAAARNRQARGPGGLHRTPDSGRRGPASRGRHIVP